MKINNIIRQIDEANAKINQLERDIESLRDYIKDKFPLRRGDKFKYYGAYCGTMMYMKVYTASWDKAFIMLEYLKDDGDYDAIYHVDCDGLEKIKTKEEEK